MRQPRIYPKVAKDMFFIQSKWAFQFLIVMLIIQVVKTVTTFFKSSNENSFYDATFIAANIFMLVIGIISAIAFLPSFVRNGVTRKDYFKGTLIGTFGVAVAIPIISAVVSTILDLIFKIMNVRVVYESFESLNVVDEGNGIADIIISIIFTPYVDLSSNWILALVVFAINLFTYYIAGWLVGAAFSRLGILGIVSIVLAFILIYVQDLLVSISFGLPVPAFLKELEVPIVFPLIGIVVAIVLVCLVIRVLTKRIIVKY
ncbi:hypothetical protein [Metabacillus malikii]|uniref:ABC transporter permease n=1 Tax=Metabacillus malikii TaxID=1504265 RepID=A0ABT9ZB36_9BACI|nr:hypothetical protein [Metabacillus malikii]MDQ0229041.1 hypothetical protein [Metabacillus malikii]